MHILSKITAISQEILEKKIWFAGNGKKNATLLPRSLYLSGQIGNAIAQRMCTHVELFFFISTSLLFHNCLIAVSLLLNLSLNHSR